MSNSNTNENLNVLVVTHNSRLRCFLSKIHNGEKILRFKNCAILKIVIELKPYKNINKNSNANIHTITLIHEGEKGSEISKPDEKYYSAIGSGVLSPKFDTLNYYPVHPTSTTLKEVYSTITLYVVRHAEGVHNPKNSKYKGWINRLTSILQIPLYIDPGLSQVGVSQAINAGNFLAEKGIVFAYAFTSELKRTRQTADIIIDTLDKIKHYKHESSGPNQSISHQHNLKIQPIPCINEISDYARGACDDFKLNSNLMRAPENKSECFKIKNQHVLNENCTKHNTDWFLYQKLNSKCYGTNFIENILNAIQTACRPPKKFNIDDGICE